MSNAQNPAEGQFFTLQPVPPPKPKANTHWGSPLALGLLAIPLLMFGFGFAQQQQPMPSVSPSLEASPTSDATPQQTTATTQTPAAQPVESTTGGSFALPSDSATLPIARVYCPGRAANFRTAPSLHSQINGILQDGDLLELLPERRVQQAGVIWLPVRFRGQAGWLASNFIGGQTHAEP